MTIVTSQLHRMGWLRVHSPRFAKDPISTITRFASQLGQICPGRNGRAIETLRPTNTTEAKPNSLSAKHGIGSFPFHTDGAHLPRPPRFIILTCQSPGATPVLTTLVRSEDLQLSAATSRLIESAVFIFRNGRRSFYSSIYNPADRIIRFDDGCMKPETSAAMEAKNAFAEGIRRTSPIMIDWQVGDVLIIDNWRLLHSRGSNDMNASSDRTLIRIGVL